MFQVEAVADFDETVLGDSKPQDMLFLSFKSGDIITTKETLENGWWYGTIVKKMYGEEEKDQKNELQSKKKKRSKGKEIEEMALNIVVKEGYYPSNYVKVLVPSTNEAKALGDTEHEKDNTPSWMEYAKEYLDEDEIRKQNRAQEMTQGNQNSNPEGILAYKKVRLNDNNVAPEISVSKFKTSKNAIAIKDQSQTAKAYRQMYHYFDYDKWIDEMNAHGVKKAKADPRRRKDKMKKIFKLK